MARTEEAEDLARAMIPNSRLRWPVIGAVGMVCPEQPILSERREEGWGKTGEWLGRAQPPSPSPLMCKCVFQGGMK